MKPWLYFLAAKHSKILTINKKSSLNNIVRNEGNADFAVSIDDGRED